MVNADVGCKDKTAVVGLDNRVVGKTVTVVVDIFKVESASSWVPHATLKFPFDPPVEYKQFFLIVFFRKNVN